MLKTRIAAVATMLVLAAPAHASIFDIYGFNARGIGMAGAMSALADDYTGTFYNPGAITQSKQITFGGGFIFTKPWVSVTRSRPICLELPDVCEAAYGVQYSSRESILPESFSGFTLGWVFPFGGVFQNRLAFAFAIYLPTINVVRAEALDPQTPQFYMYQNLPDQTVILASLAYEPTDWLSVGVGIQVLANVFGSADLQLNIFRGDFDSENFKVELIPKAAATAGIHLKPIPNLRIGITYRQEIDLTFQVPANISLGESMQLNMDIGGRVLYTPHSFSFGASYTFADPRLTISLQADFALWELAPDPAPNVTVDFQGVLLEGLGLGDALDISTNESPVNLHFRNTWTPRVGVEWEPLPWFRLRGGYYYRPTPAPRATGPSSYLDNDLHAFTFGVAFVIDDPLKVHRKPVTIEIGNQFGWLPGRTVHKDSPDDPVGNLEHGGFTYSVSISINHSY